MRPVIHPPSYSGMMTSAAPEREWPRHNVAD
jgi:hypothetical protein